MQTSITASDSGVYRAPAGLRPLREHAERAGVAWLEVDLGAIQDKAQLLSALARACAFPGTFGANWDALADSLQDFSWKPALGGYVLHLRNAARTTQVLERDWAVLVQIFDDAAAYWRPRGKAFVVLVDSGARLPVWT